MTSRKPFLALAVLAALSTGAVFAAPPAAGDAPRPAKLDKNGDGVIDRSEAAADPKLAAQFDTLDTNKDGKLSRDERPHHRGPGRGGRGEWLSKLDTNKDGRISREEAKADPKFAARFDEMDINKDGFVDRADREPAHAAASRRVVCQGRYRQGRQVEQGRVRCRIQAAWRAWPLGSGRAWRSRQASDAGQACRGQLSSSSRLPGRSAATGAALASYAACKPQHATRRRSTNGLRASRRPFLLTGVVALAACDDEPHAGIRASPASCSAARWAA